MMLRAMLAATALFCFSAQVQGQAMNAANGDPLPRGKAEEVGMSSERLGEIEKAIKADIEKGRLPGAVIAIARKGKLVYYEAFGFRDKAAGVADDQGHDLQHRVDDQADGRRSRRCNCRSAASCSPTIRCRSISRNSPR